MLKCHLIWKQVDFIIKIKTKTSSPLSIKKCIAVFQNSIQSNRSELGEGSGSMLKKRALCQALLLLLYPQITQQEAARAIRPKISGLSPV